MTIWRRVVFFIGKATLAQAHARAHARTHAPTRTHRNIQYFLPTSMISWTRLNVALYVHCLSCYRCTSVTAELTYGGTDSSRKWQTLGWPGNDPACYEFWPLVTICTRSATGPYQSSIQSTTLHRILISPSHARTSQGSSSFRLSQPTFSRLVVPVWTCISSWCDCQLARLLAGISRGCCSIPGKCKFFVLSEIVDPHSSSCSVRTCCCVAGAWSWPLTFV